MFKLIASAYSWRLYTLEGYKLTATWNATDAKTEYVLSQKTHKHVDGFARPTTGWREVSRSASREWAERNAEHYGIEIEDAPDAQP